MDRMGSSGVFLAFLILSCPSPQLMTDTKPAALPRLEVVTDGGFVGRGVGGIVIDGGAVTASDLAHSCKGELSDGDRHELARDLATFKPVKGAPAHPDQIGYTLTAGELSATWHGEDAPASAAPLFKTVWTIRQRVLAGCR